MLKKIILILALICMIVFPACGQTGNYTTHNLFYLPDYGAYGLTEYNEYNEYMEIADAQIWANKTDIAGIDLSLYYLKTEVDTLSKVEAIYTKDIIDSDELATLKFTDLDDTPAAYDNGKYAKSTADGLVWDTPAGGGTVTTSGTPETNDIARFTDATTIEGVNYTELKTALALSSANLSDRATIAMLDENEVVTGWWKYKGFTISDTFEAWFDIERITDTPTSAPYMDFRRKRDGDPTYNLSSGDVLGFLDFTGWYTDYSEGARIRAVVDGTPGSSDMPGRLEFLTTPDGSPTPALRMAIDSAGNIKMGDGAWTNYVNVTNAGAMTAEGTASIKATDLVIANQAAGDILYFNGTNWIRLAKGTAGQILTMNAGGTAPEWQTP